MSNSDSLVITSPYSKQLGIPPYYYRYKTIPSADPYQIQKLIQNTVRVDSSVYISNKGPLSAYVPPNKDLYGVCWNQMSDRPIPSIQRASIPTGTNSALNRRHTSVTSSKPGSQTPGGIGCDIKHNSYERYLNRLKGKGPLRRGIVGVPVPVVFNCATPIYGNKTIKTNIINGCVC